MLDGYRTLLDHAAQLERSDPVSKGSFFYTSHESARRPEVVRHHERLERLSVPDSLLLTEGIPREATSSTIPGASRRRSGRSPSALEELPLTAEVPKRTDRAALEAAADGVARLVEVNPDAALTLAHRGWPAGVLEQVPDAVDPVDLRSTDGR